MNDREQTGFKAILTVEEALYATHPELGDLLDDALADYRDGQVLRELGKCRTGTVASGGEA